MHDEHPHHLLAQVPLTVSPFLTLPTATPLPYTYKQLPSTLPPSILSQPPSQNPNQNPSNQTSSDPHQPAYIVSSTGQTATPDTILSSCLALQSHLTQLETSAKSTLQEWEDRRRAADLAEKRRVAPGWLDGDVKLLVPENASSSQGQDVAMGEGDEEREGTERGPQPERRTSVGIKGLVERRDGVPNSRVGEEIDRAFGSLDIK